jgi:hypothetical protein
VLDEGFTADTFDTLLRMRMIINNISKNNFTDDQMTKRLQLAQKIYADTSKLTASDLLSNEDYECGRAELLRLATQHRKPRRLRLTPDLNLVFENRFTAWLQIQEELRWLTHPTERDIDEVLTRCNLLVPYPNQLTATLFVDGGDKPTALYWIECVAANALNIALRLSGRVLRGQSQASSSGVRATVHTLVFQPTAHCGPTSQIIWGDPAVQHAAPLSAVTRHALTRDLNPTSNPNCFVALTAGRLGQARPAHPTTAVGPPSLALNKYPPLRVVMACKPEKSGNTP